MNDWALAVDIGGTKLAAARVREDGSVQVRAQRPTPVTSDPDEVWAALVSVVADVTAGEEPDRIGVGCGGPMRWPEGEVSALNIPAWRDFPLRRRLTELHAEAVVRVHNDAVAMAVGEHWRGAGRGSVNFLGVVVSTGVGGGLVLGNRIVNGRTGNAGHIGHVVVEPAGPRCACGGQGCLEAVARGPAVVEWAEQHGWLPPAVGASGVALAESALAGDPVALAAFARSGSALGLALASVVASLDLDAVAVGGGLANAGELLLGPVQEAFDHYARLSFSRDCRIGAAELGADAGLVGAAAFVLAPDRYWPVGAD